MSVPPNSAADRIPAANFPLPAPPRVVNGWPETDHPALQQLRGGSAAEQEAALGRLFLAYAQPLRHYIRQHWPLLPEADIDDIASEFATHCLTGEKAHFLTYDPDRPGPRVRLRTYLCHILDNFLINHHRHTTAKFRGGNRKFESLDTANPAAHHERPGDDFNPGLSVNINAYDRHWAQHILSLAFQALETGSAGTRAALPALRPWILADPGDATLKELARTLGRTHAALRAQLHRLRKTWREAVRHAVAETVSHPDDVDDELRHLAAVLSRHPVE